MERTKFLSVCFLIILLCSCSEDIRKVNVNNISKIEFEYTFTEKDPIASGPQNIILVKDSLLIFSDFFAQRILQFNKNSKKIKPIGFIGRGPGEYSIPTNLQKLNDSTFAFTEIRSSSIRIFDINGNDQKKFIHGLGGDAKFEINDSIYAVYGLTNNQVNIFRNEHIEPECYFPYESNYAIPCQRTSGGGIVIIDSLIFSMNAIQPQLNVLDLKSKETKKIKLKELFKYSTNIDEGIIRNITKQNASEYSRKWKVFKLFKVNINNSAYLLINARNESGSDTYLYTTQGKIIFEIEGIDKLVSTQDNLIFTNISQEIKSGQINKLQILKFKGELL